MQRMVLSGLIFVACNPWTEIHQREMLWYDAKQLEQQLDLELVEMPQGGFLGNNPRIIIREESIEFDNRSWFLNLPDSFFLADEESFNAPEAIGTEAQQRYLIEETVLLLENKRIPSNDRDNLMIDRLYEILTQHVEMNMELGRMLQDDRRFRFTGELTVVVEPEVPLETVYSVLFTAWQSMFGNHTFAVKVGDKVRGALSQPQELFEKSDTGPTIERFREACAMTCSGDTDQGIGRMSCGGVAFVADETCSPSWELLLEEVIEVQRWCAKSAAPIEIDEFPGSYTYLRDCVQVFSNLSSDNSFEEFIGRMQSSYDLYPTIQQYYYPAVPTDSFLSKPNLQQLSCDKMKRLDQLSKEQLLSMCELRER
jgi:hypothetical protein